MSDMSKSEGALLMTGRVPFGMRRQMRPAVKAGRMVGGARRSAADGECPVHQGRMAGEGADVRVGFALLELGHVERGGVGLAAANQLGVGDDPGVVRLFVAVGRAG